MLGGGPGPDLPCTLPAETEPRDPRVRPPPPGTPASALHARPPAPCTQIRDEGLRETGPSAAPSPTLPPRLTALLGSAGSLPPRALLLRWGEEAGESSM